ncbi:REP-associated tyrosine transposase [Legionella bononiensis]|uniref:Transposase n=2 Tax=Legionella bononiensis TaxID=2793102 RepID=A0ABS1WAQ0_9GAMM|nr:transposase [Legionella bononiensis]MBL7480341.1 transposase [Legionella bononiensis]MBL7526427.1 transposase [Legionella bononiensis]MBL7563079.1 transposase [Legionella bononiensis]
MVNYRRDKTQGGTYFFTLTLKDRTSNLITYHIPELRHSFLQAQKNNPFIIHAVVVLPDHVHLIMELPEKDSDYSTRLRQIKTYFSQEIKSSGESILKNLRGEYNLWQRRFWEHRIRDESDFNSHVNYIHFNPVKHGLVKEVIEWPYSSFHRYVREGRLPRSWGGVYEGKFGE